MISNIIIKLPSFIKNILFQFYSYYTYRERYSTDFKYYSKKFDQCNGISLLNPYSLVPLSKEIKILYGITTLKTISDFKVIDRNDLILMLNHSDYYNKIKFNKSLSTSGSTGTPLLIPIDNDFMKYKFASIYFFKNIHNCGINVKSGNFFGRKIFSLNNKIPPFWLHSIFTNQVLFSQYHINEKNIRFYISAIRKYKLKTIHGYPSVLTIFSEIVRKLNLETEVHKIGLLNITVGSETLSNYQKQIIQNTFNCKVLNFYGQTESVVDIFECEKGSMHINEAFSFVELIETNTKGIYNLIGTQLRNNKFPLIRYNTGDLVEYDSAFCCGCGRKSRVITNIVGRNEDYILLDNGTKIGRLDHIFKNSFNTIECQIIQNKIGQAIFNIVKGDNYSQNDEALLIKNIKDMLGNHFKFEIIYCDVIEKTKSGKLKQVINNIKK